MKLCTCGGHMYRMKVSQLKTTKEWKLHFKCNACGVSESTYHDTLPEVRYQRNGRGRPSYVEVAA